jgi:hypothetical protein
LVIGRPRLAACQRAWSGGEAILSNGMGESQFLEKPEARTVRLWEFLVYARQLS